MRPINSNEKPQLIKGEREMLRSRVTVKGCFFAGLPPLASFHGKLEERGWVSASWEGIQKWSAFPAVSYRQRNGTSRSKGSWREWIMQTGCSSGLPQRCPPTHPCSAGKREHLPIVRCLRGEGSSPLHSSSPHSAPNHRASSVSQTPLLWSKKKKTKQNWGGNYIQLAQ